MNWVWMGRVAHFIGGDSCHFHLATVVGNGHYIVSTVGDYHPHGVYDEETGNRTEAVEIGLGRFYETMVFPAEKQPAESCCPYHVNASDGELDMKPYNSDREAALGHAELCEKWDRRVDP